MEFNESLLTAAFLWQHSVTMHTIACLISLFAQLPQCIPCSGESCGAYSCLSFIRQGLYLVPLGMTGARENNKVLLCD